MPRYNLLTRNWNLGDTNQMLLDSVRRFARTVLPEHLTTAAQANQPRTVYEKLGSMGLLGPTLPEPYGQNINYQTAENTPKFPHNYLSRGNFITSKHEGEPDDFDPSLEGSKDWSCPGDGHWLQFETVQINQN